ncbi:MAG TPA: hypothetical protein PKH07_08450 [bacterium]|nr:hypothetical protein [bacterium]
MIRGKLFGLAVLPAFILVRYARRKIAWWYKNAVMRKKAESILSQLPFLQRRREIGSGNIGIVYDVMLNNGWRDEMQVLWQTLNPMPERVAVKIVPMESGSRQAETLCHLAPRIESATAASKPLALCPFLALGLLNHHQTREPFLVEIMPFLQAESLLKVLRREKVQYREGIKELMRVFDTIFFLESQGCFERSLDNENVMVLPDGTWIRIDVDSAEMVQAMPRYRMIRVARLTAEVLERLHGVPDRARLRSVLRRLQLTAKCPLKRYEGKPLPKKYQGALFESPEEVRDALLSILEGA